MTETTFLSLDAFVRSIGVNRGTPYALFLGAGASITSGMPSAATCIWEWKRSIFLTNNPGLESQFSELSLPAVRTKIQKWLDSQRRFPQAESPSEYGFYIQECFPIVDDRSAFFRDKVRSAIPHVGYRMFVKLAEAGIFSSVWTPNFDGLVAKAAASSGQIIPIEVGIDCQQRLPRRLNRNELLCVSLHGDYRYDRLKNTEAEVQNQESLLRDALIAETESTSLIVVGYSGRDESIMSALEDAYSRPGSGILYWCGFGDAEPPDRIGRLIEKARSSGRGAFYVPSSGFDDLILRLAAHCLSGNAAKDASDVLFEEVRVADTKASFQLPDLPPCGLIKSNAFLLTPPAEIYKFSLSEWPKEHIWKYFHDSTAGKPVIAAPLGGKAYALGTVEGIRSAFGSNLRGSVERVPIDQNELGLENGVINSTVRKTLIRIFTDKHDLKSDGRRLVWKREPRERRKVLNTDVLIHDALLIYLRTIDNKNYVVLKPTVRVGLADGNDAPKEIERAVKMPILGWQHNAEFNQAVEEWRKTLFITESFDFPENCGSPFKFRIRKSPLLARVTTPEKSKQIQIRQKYLGSETQVAVELSEPKLVYSRRAGEGLITDVHPVRGILQNRPFDYPLTSRRLTSSIQMAVICPAREANQLSQYLQQLQTSTKPSQSESDYLPPFPGFQSAFAIPLEIPKPGDSLWVTCPDIDPNASPSDGALGISRNITQSLAALKASAAPNVTLVFIPSRWAMWRAYETESERFDLHNFVKAFCVPQGIATQFLEQGTFQDKLQCRVRWWLSLAIYVKSMRTPWILESLDTESAFVGFGLSVDRKAQAGNHVVLGCSHLYNSQGQSLQFRLSKIENPIIRRKNAFMSFDDARRVGETIRQLFWEARFRLPNRVVIHKPTPFLDDERKGLETGLSGVKELELLEIYVDDALRYLASVPQRDGTFKEDHYPMKRGTLLKLSLDTALLWVHGLASGLQTTGRYYQGKRRIPAPLAIRRHAGRSDLTTVAEEILGLSKMNWNSFDLYTQNPATIESSSQIARIGSLLERFGSTSYDYRLFM